MLKFIGKVFRRTNAIALVDALLDDAVTRLQFIELPAPPNKLAAALVTDTLHVLGEDWSWHPAVVASAALLRAANAIQEDDNRRAVVLVALFGLLQRIDDGEYRLSDVDRGALDPIQREARKIGESLNE